MNKYKDIKLKLFKVVNREKYMILIVYINIKEKVKIYELSIYVKKLEKE